MTVIEKMREENQGCQHALNTLRQENAHLKYLLSEMVDKNEERNFLAKAELLQNELLKKDEEIGEILKNALEFETGLKHIAKSRPLPDQVFDKHIHIKDECTALQLSFSQLSENFLKELRPKQLS